MLDFRFQPVDMPFIANWLDGERGHLQTDRDRAIWALAKDYPDPIGTRLKLLPKERVERLVEELRPKRSPLHAPDCSCKLCRD